MISFWAFSLSPGIFYATRRQDRVVHTRNPRKAAPQRNFVASVDMRGPIWDWGAWLLIHSCCEINRVPWAFQHRCIAEYRCDFRCLLNTFQKQVKTQMVKNMVQLFLIRISPLASVIRKKIYPFSTAMKMILTVIWDLHFTSITWLAVHGRTTASNFVISESNSTTVRSYNRFMPGFAQCGIPWCRKQLLQFVM